MDIGLNEELSLILRYSRDEAMRTGYYGILPEHLLLGILRHRDNAACRAMEAAGADIARMKKELDARISRGWSVPYAEQDNINLTQEGNNALSIAVARAKSLGEESVSPLHLLNSLLHCGSVVLDDVLRDAGIDASCLQGASTVAGDRNAAAERDGAMDRKVPSEQPGVHTFIYPYQTTQSGCS